MINYKVNIPRDDLNKVIDNVLKLDSINDELWEEYKCGDHLERINREDVSLITKQHEQLSEWGDEVYAIWRNIRTILCPYTEDEVLKVLFDKIDTAQYDFGEIVCNELYFGNVSYIDLRKNFLMIYALLRLIGDELV